MHDQAILPAVSPAESAVLPPAVLQLARALAEGFARQAPQEPPRDAPVGRGDDAPLMTVAETARMMRLSRMTIDRMVDAGELPAVVVRRGARQVLRRIPRAFVERLIATAAAGAQVSVAECAAEWLAAHQGSSALAAREPAEPAGGLAVPA